VGGSEVGGEVMRGWECRVEGSSRMGVEVVDEDCEAVRVRLCVERRME